MDALNTDITAVSMGRREKSAQTTTKLVSVKKANIPSYLHTSEFYQSLCEEEEEESYIMVPGDCIKGDDSVAGNEDLRSLLLTLRFWISGYICDSILDYAMSQPFDSFESTLSEFYVDMPYLKHLKAFPGSSTPMLQAVKTGYPDYVKYFLKQGSWPADACDIICRAGNAVLLKYAIDNGCFITRDATAFAAGAGRVACLQLLHEIGAYWDEKTTTAAAKGDHLACLNTHMKMDVPGCAVLTNLMTVGMYPRYTMAFL